MATDTGFFQPEESLSLLGKQTLLLSSKFQNDAKNLKKKSDGQFFRAHISAFISFSVSCFVVWGFWVVVFWGGWGGGFVCFFNEHKLR